MPNVNSTRESRRKYSKQYYAENRERIRLRANDLQNSGRAEIKVRNKARYAKERDKERARRGLPVALRTEPKVCDICGGQPMKGKGFNLDHCHVTGAFRGWLCHKCNLGLGMLGDTTDSILKVLQYLKNAELL